MNSPTDDDLRELFAPLTSDEPRPGEFEELRRRTAARSARGRSRRGVVALTVATATAAILLAAWPARGPGGPQSDPHDSVLATAAAVAAEEPVPTVADAPLRYAKVRHTFTYSARDGDLVARSHHEQIIESWVGARWRGRERSDRGRHWISGDVDATRGKLPIARPGDGPDPLTEPVDRPYAYGDGPLAELDPAELPAGRESIARVVRDGIRTNRWSADEQARGRPDGLIDAAARDTYATYASIGLLVHARLTPDQRAALLDVLASDPAADDLGTLRDSEGRAGAAVDLTYDAPGHASSRVPRFRVIFDRDSAEILEWAMWPPGGDDHPWAPARVDTVLSTGYADVVGERP